MLNFALRVCFQASQILQGVLFLHSWWFHCCKCRKYLVTMLTRKVPLFFQRSWDLISPMVCCDSFYIVFTWCFSSACQLNCWYITGKPVQPEDLQKIESIVKQRIEAELELSAQEIKLANPKRVNGLRAVFGEVRSLTQLDIPCCHISFACPVILCNSFYIWAL